MHDSASNLEHVGTDRENQRELYVLSLDHPRDVLRLKFKGQYATILLVWDASDISNETIVLLARRLIDAGGVYFCTWGPDCERVHDLIDAEWVGEGFTPADDPTLMTTWHNGVPLAEAISFAAFVAFPIDTYFDECRPVIAVCIGCSDWAAEVRVAFTDLQRFNNDFIEYGQ